MNEIVRLPTRPRPRLVEDIVDYAARGRPHYAAFLRARLATHAAWTRLIESGELDPECLRQEADGSYVLGLLLEMHTAPNKPPPAA